MRNRYSPFYALCAATLICSAALPVHADDTEIYLGEPTQTSAESRPNILFVMDTSGSMDTAVDTQTTYDPAVTYTGDCTPDRVYWKAKGATFPNASNDLPVRRSDCSLRGDAADNLAGWVSASNFLCKTGQSVIDVNGFVNVNRAAQWKPAGDATKSRWSNLRVLTGNNDINDKQIECADDSDLNKINPPHGDGSKKYAANDKNGPFTDELGQLINWTTSEVDRGYVFYTSNYLNWYYHAQTVKKSRLTIVKEALHTLVAGLSNANVGLMRFSTNGEGGMVIKAMEDVATSRDTMLTAIDSLQPSGTTPLSETYSEALRYWRGMSWDYGKTAKPDNSTDPAARSGETYNSPIGASCQKNFIVLLTDGEPVADSWLPNHSPTMTGFQDYLDAYGKLPKDVVKGTGTCTPNQGTTDTNGVCLDDLAGFAHDEDLAPANEVGDQSITTYTVGFGGDVQSVAWAVDVLKNTAKRGGGEFFTAGDNASLNAAFSNIIGEILSVNTTFTAPTVAVNAFNRTQNLSDLYITVFGTPQPPAAGNKFHWPGNIKKYKIETTGTIVGEDGQAVVENGFFKKSAHSFWQSGEDGPNVTVGGAAHKLPSPDTRVIYTDVVAGADITADDNKVLPDNANITPAMLGLDDTATADDKKKLINWIRGADVDAEAVADQSKARFEMGDPLHGRPATVIYGGTEDNPDLVLFAVTNDGYLHAINTKDGKEIWSFIPTPMLSRMRDLYEDKVQSAKRYGLDGNIRIYKSDLNNNGTVDGTDAVYLFFGEGRGGESYYALDVTDRGTPKLLWRRGSANELKADGTPLASNEQLPGLAQTWSTPVITKVKIGTAQPQLVAIFAGGYDPSQDNLVYNTDDVGNRIYMVDAVSGTLLWRAGPASDADTSHGAVLKIDEGVTDDARKMNNSFPGDVRVIDLDGDQLADRMYAADTGGRVWKFDINNGSAANALVNGGVFASLGRGGGVGSTTTDARRFYYAPDVSMLKQNGNAFLNIAIGSGYRGHPLDEQIHDRFYSLRDRAPFVRLSQADFKTFPYITDGSTKLVDVTTNIKPTIPADADGWKMDLNDPTWAGEKVLAESITFANTIIFTTYLPQSGDTVAGSNSCVARQGTNRLYAVSAIDGSPVLNRDNSVDENGNVSPTGDDRQDRYGELDQSGIAPEAVILFPETSTPTCLVGVESCGVSFTNDPVRTFWYQRDTEGSN